MRPLFYDKLVFDRPGQSWPPFVHAVAVLTELGGKVAGGTHHLRDGRPTAIGLGVRLLKTIDTVAEGIAARVHRGARRRTRW